MRSADLVGLREACRRDKDVCDESPVRGHAIAAANHLRLRPIARWSYALKVPLMFPDAVKREGPLSAVVDDGPVAHHVDVGIRAVGPHQHEHARVVVHRRLGKIGSGGGDNIL